MRRVNLIFTYRIEPLMNKLLLIVSCLLLAVAVAGQNGDRGKAVMVCGKAVKYHRLKTDRRKTIRYLIYRNLLTGTQSYEIQRAARTFLDAEAFSEENLKTLFFRLSMKYNEATMQIWVETDPTILRSLKECAMLDGGLPETPSAKRFPRAVFLRYGSNEFFFYDDDRSQSRKTVILKGKYIRN